jgi:hypothetical protein
LGASVSQCGTCGKGLPKQTNGRPRLYCSDRCKEKAKQKAKQVAARVTAAVSSEGAGLCHVCSRGAATVGTPRPLLCGACAVAPAAEAD